MSAPSAILVKGYRILAPPKRVDGTWSDRHQVIAAFLDVAEATRYTTKKLESGIPAYMRGPGEKWNDPS